MDKKEFEVSGKKFTAGKINALKQAHVVRRLSPILGDLFPLLREVKVSEDSPEEVKLTAFAKVAAPALAGFAKLSDEDFEYVLFTLLEAVEMQQPHGNWAKVVAGRMLAFQDMPLPTLVQLAFHSFQHNCGNFFSGLPHQ